jgi:hypothetical protein
MRTSWPYELDGNGFFTRVEWGRFFECVGWERLFSTGLNGDGFFDWVGYGRLFHMGWMGTVLSIGWMTAFSSGTIIATSLWLRYLNIFPGYLNAPLSATATLPFVRECRGELSPTLAVLNSDLMFVILKKLAKIFIWSSAFDTCKHRAILEWYLSYSSARLKTKVS